MEVPYCHTVICHLSRFDGEMHRQLPLVAFCLRRRVFGDLQSPSRQLADFQSARVADPLLPPPVDCKSTGTNIRGNKGNSVRKNEKNVAKSAIFAYFRCVFSNPNVCSRGFAIPESLTTDFQSARVADPLLISLWIANSQGQMFALPFVLSLIMFRPLAKKRVEN